MTSIRVLASTTQFVMFGKEDNKWKTHTSTSDNSDVTWKHHRGVLAVQSIMLYSDPLVLDFSPRARPRFDPSGGDTV